MKLKIPPAFVALIIGCVMWVTDYLIHPANMEFVAPAWISGIVLGSAVLIAFLGLFQFYRKGASVDPHKPEKASVLVTTGVYRFTRNPMYLGLLMVLIGFGFKLGNLPAFLVIPAFVWYMNRFQIEPEEEALIEKFGSEYEAYKSTVRRWL